ncbi:phosphoLipid scramblase [Acrasis kona]|uniref:Phospholipid scramblase n=1 Tax=Acrasis kona TaxID=1008807 RepID=A0AAW2Z6H1_9EUKA
MDLQENEHQPTSPVDTFSHGSLIDHTFGPNGSVFINVLLEAFEERTGFEAENRYNITFENGYKVVGLEESDFMNRWCCGSLRPFVLNFAFKENKIQFLRLVRPFSFFIDEIFVFNEQDDLLGKVKSNLTLFTRELTIYGLSNNKLYKLEGSMLQKKFMIKNYTTREKVGEIRRGTAAPQYEDVEIVYPRSASPSEKALILGSAIFIDYLYYEQKVNMI